MFISMSFFRLEKFFFVLLKILSGPMSCNSSLSSILICHRFDLFIVSKISWMFFVRNFFLGLTFSLTDVSTYSLVSSTHEILASISYSVAEAYLFSTCLNF